MVQGITFDKQLLASEDFAHQVNYFYQGKMGVSKGCEVSADVSGNLVISDGYFSIYGRLLKNVGDTVVEVPSVPSGVLYSILVFEVDLTKENTIDTFNQGQFKIVSNAVTYPTLVQENLDNGGMVYQLEFARFENTVNGIVNLQDTRTILSMQMYALGEDFNRHLAEDVTKSDVIQTTEVNDSTKIPSSVVTFALNQNIASLSNRVSSVTATGAISNLNSLADKGKGIHLNYFNNTATNAPASNSGMVITFVDTDTYLVQFAITVADVPSVYIRSRFGGTWKSWITL